MQNEKNINKRPVNTQKADEIFRELQKSLKLPGYDSPAENKPEPRVAMKRPVTEKKPAYSFNKPIREGRPQAKKQAVKKPMQKISEKVAKPVVAVHTPTMAENLDFDPRKAVIFAEILKRPQF